MRGFAPAGVLVLALLAVPARAEAVGDPVCHAASDTAAAPVAYDVKSGPDISITIMYGADRQVASVVDGMKPADAKCIAASLKIGESDYLLAADDMAVVTRRTRYAQPGHRNAYLIVTLRPDAAMRVSEAWHARASNPQAPFAELKQSDFIYMLAAGASGNDVLDIYGFYSGIPDTPRLARAMCAAIEGSLPPIARYQTSTKNLQALAASTGAALADPMPTGACILGPPAAMTGETGR